ncbi:hypothetical protein DY000_02041623 [Brassica cretica]|uniref:Uncharacterized protein n=1 Tax=Brassica cretica TaxID=69181 RepID=A0ABQ7BE67_BRACR|nr:hypothetical protein DY000_02041623 [Brassica cretica]
MVKGRATRDAMKAAKRCKNREGKGDRAKSENYGAVLELYMKESIEYVSSSTRSNKETQLLFSPDPASLERSICKEVRSSSIDNNTCSSLDFVQPPSTQTLVPSTDTRSPPSTEDTHLLSTEIVHPTSIDTLV